MTVDFVVTGTGRCGTGFTSAALVEAGLVVGHEEWWTVDPGRRRHDLVGDVSWLAVPELDAFDGPVVQQVRHPLAVIRSLVGIQMFTDARHGAYRWFMFAHQEGLRADDLHDAAVWWLRWNERIEQHAGLLVRVEDLDAEGLAELTEFVGHPVALPRLEAAVHSIGRSVNARPRADDITWDDLPDPAVRDEIRAAAARYGYAD